MVKLLYNRKIRITGIAIITLLRFFFTSADVIMSPEHENFSVFLRIYSLALFNTVAAWEATRLLVVYFTRKYGIGKASSRRFGREVFWVCVVNSVLYAVFIGILMWADPAERPPAFYWLFGFVDRCLYGLLIAGFYELLVFIHAMQIAREEAEELKKLNVTIQLESLKNQVKPHFLFNSLNTLTGLVETNSAQSVRFIAELSNVYRYLLQSSEKELIPLREELAFGRAYFFLLHMRFGEGIEWCEEVPQAMQEQLLPPLTLQMLLENCIKHNQVSTRKPLRVQISAADGWLMVRNNLQPKRQQSSTGVGLSNIAAKLRLLNQPAMEVEKTNEHFYIRVPLIQPQPA